MFEIQYSIVQLAYCLNMENFDLFFEQKLFIFVIRLSDLCPLFGRPQPELSMIVHEVSQCILSNHWFLKNPCVAG